MHIQFDNEWLQIALRNRAKWFVWRPISIHFEKDCKAWGGWWQLEFYLLGFGLIIFKDAEE